MYMCACSSSSSSSSSSNSSKLIYSQKSNLKKNVRM